MKRFISWMMLVLLGCLSACGIRRVEKPPENDTAFTEPETEASTDTRSYRGNYEEEPVWQSIKEIETTKDPDALCRILSALYGEEFSYIKMTQKSTGDADTGGYEAPYEDFFCISLALYLTSSPLAKMPFVSDTYAFFRPYHESPSFIMDSDAVYLVSDRQMKEFEDGVRADVVTSWIMSDLFLSLHGYIDADPEKKASYEDSVRHLDFYLDFENRIINSLEGDAGSIRETQSLNPRIEITSVDFASADSPDYLTLEFRIENISLAKGAVEMILSGNTITSAETLHFNDPNFRNDFTADGSYSFWFFYPRAGSVPASVRICYGYGQNDPDKGWTHETEANVRILRADDFGVISSTTIPADEIHPLYFEDQYFGAWTASEQGDLMEIHRNSDYLPFEQNGIFHSEDGHVVSVDLSEEVPLFTMDGVFVGAPYDVFINDDIVMYMLFYESDIFVSRYPHDQCVRVQYADAVLGAGDVFLYP